MSPQGAYDQGHANGERDAWIESLRETVAKGFAEAKKERSEIFNRLNNMADKRCGPRAKAIASLRANVRNLWWVMGLALPVVTLIVYILVEAKR